MTVSTDIHPTAIVERGAELGPGVTVGPYCIIGAKANIGENVRLNSHVVIAGRTEIGARTVIHSFASLGGPPQHTGYRGEDTRLVVGADNIIREYATMSLGTPGGRGETRVGARGMFMTACHVGHDCVVGDNVVLANAASLGGHVEVGEGAILGALCGIHQHGRIGAFAMVGGVAAVAADIIPYGLAFGNHAHLAGLNVIGMKRRGLARDTIRDLRAAFKLLFESRDGTFRERVAQVERELGGRAEVRRVLDFIAAGGDRPLMAPAR